jgi:hypothetical protein
MNRRAGSQIRTPRLCLPVLLGDPSRGGPTQRSGRLGVRVLSSLCSCARENVCDIGPKATDFGVHLTVVARIPLGAAVPLEAFAGDFFGKKSFHPLSPVTTTLGDAWPAGSERR